jgi:hypothetical protein
MDLPLDPPDVYECEDCGAETDGRTHAPDYSPGYHPGKVGPVVCSECLKQYDPNL